MNTYTSTLNSYESLLNNYYKGKEVLIYKLSFESQLYYTLDGCSSCPRPDTPYMAIKEGSYYKDEKTLYYFDKEKYDKDLQTVTDSDSYDKVYAKIPTDKEYIDGHYYGDNANVTVYSNIITEELVMKIKSINISWYYGGSIDCFHITLTGNKGFKHEIQIKEWDTLTFIKNE